MRKFYDQLEREVVLKKVPERIISLVPSQTELLVDLGLRQQIVGITRFCVHPEELRNEKMKVGGTKQVKYGKIRKLCPDIILCNKEENTREMVEELKQIAPVHVSDVKTVDDSLELIREYGEIFEVRKAASEIVGEIFDRRREFRDFVDKFPKRKVVYFIWKAPWMVVGRDNFVDHLLHLNNFENVFGADKSRYPEVDLEQVSKKEPDLVLLSTEPYPFKEDNKNEFEKRLKKNCAHIVDGEYFSWYGSRLIAAFDYFKKLHEERLLS